MPKRLFQPLPTWLRVLSLVLLVYVLANFFFMNLVIMEGGAPAGVPGQYYLHNHAEKIRSLTDAEYLQFEAYGVRTVSGHWMLFAGAALLYFVVMRRRGSLTTRA